MARGVCHTAVLYFAINVLSLTSKPVVGQQGYKFYYSVILSPFWGTLRHRLDGKPISRTVSDIFSLKYLGVMTLTV